MPLLQRSEAIGAALFLMLAASATASAQDAAAWIDCDSVAGELVVAFEPGDASAPYAGPAEHVVRFLQLLEVDANSRIVDTHEATIECRLGTDALVVRLSPMVSNFNLLGMCGAAISGRIDIARDGVEVVDGLAFENEDCMEREGDFVARVTLRAGAGHAAIGRRRYDGQ